MINVLALKCTTQSNTVSLFFIITCDTFALCWYDSRDNANEMMSDECMLHFR